MTAPLDLAEIRDLTDLHARFALIVDKGTRGALARDDYVANAHRLAALVPALVAEVTRLRAELDCRQPVIDAATAAFDLWNDPDYDETADIDGDGTRVWAQLAQTVREMHDGQPDMAVAS